MRQGLNVAQHVATESVHDAYLTWKATLRRSCSYDRPPVTRLCHATAQCVASPVTGGLAGAAVVLSSVDPWTRRLTARLDKRLRPPRTFGVDRVQLLPLQNNMVTHLQVVVESFTGVQSADSPKLDPPAGQLTFTVRQCSSCDGEAVLDSHELPAVAFPSKLKPRSTVRVWEEVINIKPDDLDDAIVIEVAHTPDGSGQRHVLGAASLSVRQVRDFCCGSAAEPSVSEDLSTLDRPMEGSLDAPLHA